MEKINLIFVMVLFIGLIIGCNYSSEPQWTKGKVIAENLDSPGALTADEKNIYYVTGGHLASLKEGRSGVWKLQKENGKQIELFKGYQKDEKNVILPQKFVTVVDEKYLYFSAGHIYRIPKENGEPKAITKGQPTEMVLDAENIYWHNFVGEGMNDVPIFSTNKNGGEVKVIVEPRKIIDLAVDNDFIYWAEQRGIFKKNKKNSEEILVISANNGEKILGMTIDRNSIYYVENDSLKMIPKIGDAVVKLTDNVNSIHKIIVDDNFIYFVKNEGSFSTSINKIPKNGGTVTKIDSGFIESYTVSSGKIYVSDKNKIYVFSN